MAGDSGAGGDGRAAVDPDADPAELDVVLIAAVAENGVIGADGELPWDLPEDMAHFKETTMGHPVIVGRKTFENVVAGLGGPLPGRTNVVLSRSNPDLPDDESIVVVESIEAAIEAAVDATSVTAESNTDADGGTAYVMGGATVYEAFLERADRMILTEIDASYEGEAVFPGWPPGAEWREVERDELDGFAFVTYERVE